MSAFYDVRCSKCEKRFGWYGQLNQRPHCPRCQYRPPQMELDAAQAKMDEIRQRLLTHPSKASHDMRRQQRVDAGLTGRQAAKLLGITPAELCDYEMCRAEPSQELFNKMAEVYGVGKV